MSKPRPSYALWQLSSRKDADGQPNLWMSSRMVSQKRYFVNDCPKHAVNYKTGCSKLCRTQGMAIATLMFSSNMPPNKLGRCNHSGLRMRFFKGKGVSPGECTQCRFARANDRALLRQNVSSKGNLGLYFTRPALFCGRLFVLSRSWAFGLAAAGAKLRVVVTCPRFVRACLAGRSFVSALTTPVVHCQVDYPISCREEGICLTF